MTQWPQIEGAVRTLLMYLLGYAMAKGWIPTGDLAVIVGAILPLLGLVWSWWVNRPTALVQAATSVDAVNVIQLKPTPEGQSINVSTGPKVKLAA